MLFSIDDLKHLSRNSTPVESPDDELLFSVESDDGQEMLFTMEEFQQLKELNGLSGMTSESTMALDHASSTGELPSRDQTTSTIDGFSIFEGDEEEIDGMSIVAFEAR